MAVAEEDENILKFMRLALVEVLLACSFLQNFLNISLLRMHVSRTCKVDTDI